MYSDLTDIQKKLADFMSDISERAYHAGWMMNLEYVLWGALVNGERQYGRYFITQADIDNLTRLAKQSNCWIYFDNNTEETAISFEQWSRIFNDGVSANPKQVKG
jgi:hypothetical protein